MIVKRKSKELLRMILYKEGYLHLMATSASCELEEHEIVLGFADEQAITYARLLRTSDVIDRISLMEIAER